MATQQGGAEIREDDKAPTLTAAAGMSGNNQPVIAFEPGALSRVGGHFYTDGKAGTLRSNAGDNQLTVAVGEAVPKTYCIQGNCIDRADTAGCNGRGWTEDVSYTLNTIDRPAVVMQVAGFIAGNSAKAHDIGYEDDKAPTISATRHDASVVVKAEGVSLLNDQGRQVTGKDNATVAPTLRAEMHGNIPAVAMAIENHPNDSRVKLSEDGIVQTLSGRMGTGGGNTPMILECYSQDAYDKYTQAVSMGEDRRY